MHKTILAATALLAVTAADAGAQPIGIGTSPQGTLTYGLGAALASVLTDEGLRANVQPNSGTGVMVPLVETGEIQLGFVNTLEITQAYGGTGVFEGRANPNLRMVGVLFPINVGLFVRDDSPIESVHDIEGASVPWGYTSQEIIQTLMDGIIANAGLTEDDIEAVLVPNLIVGADDFASGRIDVGFFAIGPAKVSEVDAAVGGIRFIDLDDSDEAVARMREHVPPASVVTVQPREGWAGVEGPTRVMSYNYTLFVNADVDEETVYQVTKTLLEETERLGEAQPLFGTLDPAAVYRDIGVPYHPGALRYFEEAGIAMQ